VSGGQTGPSSELGELLRQHRLASGLSQEELAEKSGLSVRTIANLEHGRIARPHRRSVSSVAEALGLPRQERDRLERASRLRAHDRSAAEVGAETGQQREAIPPSVIPRQLPAALPQFAGRSGELAALAEMLRDNAGAVSTLMIAAIGGTAGIGKTALALQWAHGVARRFPDGQLYANLRGFDQSGTPVKPAEALRGFLDALGIPPARIPAAMDAQAALYRSLLARRSVLIVLDNAHDADQVRPLLPGSPSCVVVITSRRRLLGLVTADGARPLLLDVLSPADAIELLTGRLGRERIAADPQAALDLVTLCARLPLGLAIAAGRAAASPALTLRDLVADLRAATTRLDALDTGEAATSLRAVMSWSYQDLSPASARMFRLLGLHPGPDISASAAASLAGLSRQQARRVLAELTGTWVLLEYTQGRFAFHDLLRAYAAEQAAESETPAERQAAIGRMMDHYLHSAHNAAVAVSSTRRPFELPPPGPGAEPERFSALEQAIAWLTIERPVLHEVTRLAAESGLESYAWQIPLALTDYLDRQGLWAEAIGTYETSVAAARRLGDSAAQARMLRFLGEAKARVGRHDEAYLDLSQALAIREDLGDLQGQALCHGDISWVFELKGDLGQAMRHEQIALALFVATDLRYEQAESLNRLGWYQAHVGGYTEALASCKQALDISIELGDEHGQAAALDSIGYAHYHIGEYGPAVACYTESLGIISKLREPYHQALVLDHLGDARSGSGDLEQARSDWRTALAIFDELNLPDAEQLRAKLARLDDPLTADCR
jgi:tetratricopeptide (TPR) repeat protein/transcriptional regulator with XRE-family HTH domain